MYTHSSLYLLYSSTFPTRFVDCWHLEITSRRVNEKKTRVKEAFSGIAEGLSVQSLGLVLPCTYWRRGNGIGSLQLSIYLYRSDDEAGVRRLSLTLQHPNGRGVR